MGWEPCVAVSLQARLKDGIIVSCVIYSFRPKINQLLESSYQIILSLTNFIVKNNNIYNTK